MSEKEQEQQKEIEELDSFHFEGPGFNDEVNEVTFPPTILEMIENSGKFTKEQIQYLDYLVDNNTEAREALRDMTMVYFQAVDADSSNIAKEQEKLTTKIKKTFFPEKKGGRKKRRKTRRKSKKRKRKTKRRRTRRKKGRGTSFSRAATATAVGLLATSNSAAALKTKLPSRTAFNDAKFRLGRVCSTSPEGRKLKRKSGRRGVKQNIKES